MHIFYYLKYTKKCFPCIFLIHYCASKVRFLKQLCLQEFELCFTLLQNTPKMEIKEEVWNKVRPLASKVALEDELCLNFLVKEMIQEKFWQVKNCVWYNLILVTPVTHRVYNWCNLLPTLNPIRIWYYHVNFLSLLFFI